MFFCSYTPLINRLDKECHNWYKEQEELILPGASNSDRALSILSQWHTRCHETPCTSGQTLLLSPSVYVCCLVLCRNYHCVSVCVYVHVCVCVGGGGGGGGGGGVCVWVVGIVGGYVHVCACVCVCVGGWVCVWVGGWVCGGVGEVI